MLNSIILLTGEAITKKIEMSNVGWVDVVFLLAMLWAFIEGYRAGFIKEFSKFLSVLGGLLVTYTYYEQISVWIKRNSFIPQDVAIPVTFLVVLIISVVVLYYIFQFFGKLFEVKVFQLFEKVGGMLLAIARYALILGLVTQFLFFFSIPYIEDSYRTKSVTGDYLINVCPKTYKGLSKFIPMPKWELEPQITVK